MSCWMENSADKDKFPAPSHFLFGCFGWGSLQGSAGAELCSWHFLGCVSLQREGKKKAGHLCQDYLQSCHIALAPLQRRHQRWQGVDGWMEGPREGMAVPIYLLLWDLHVHAGGGEDKLLKWASPSHNSEKATPQAVYITWSLAWPQKTKWHLRMAQGLSLPQKTSAPWKRF